MKTIMDGRVEPNISQYQVKVNTMQNVFFSTAQNADSVRNVKFNIILTIFEEKK